jgi:hypothetical protein
VEELAMRVLRSRLTCLAARSRLPAEWFVDFDSHRN